MLRLTLILLATQSDFIRTYCVLTSGDPSATRVSADQKTFQPAYTNCYYMQNAAVFSSTKNFYWKPGPLFSRFLPVCPQRRLKHSLLSRHRGGTYEHVLKHVGYSEASILSNKILFHRDKHTCQLVGNVLCSRKEYYAFYQLFYAPDFYDIALSKMASSLKRLWLGYQRTKTS